MNEHELKKLLLDSRIPSDSIQFNVDMSNYSSFKVGGNAKCLIEIDSIQSLFSVCKIIKSNSLPFFILGSGSNIIFNGSGYEGVVIKLCSEFNECYICSENSIGRLKAKGYIKNDTIIDSANTMYASAATPLKNICNLALEQGLTGLEFAVGIPGSCGGAVYMNAGAYGGEMKDVIIEVNALNINTLEIETFNNNELSFSYRKSIFEAKNHIILNALFALQKGDPEKIGNKMESLMTMRNSKQPVNYPSVGSFFKRPPGHYAAKLIEEAGLKGKIIGGVQVSELHSGFLINIGDASFEDVIAMKEYICKVVKEKFDVTLEAEAEFI